MEPVPFIFRLRDPRAAAVSVVGPFNNWSTTANPMARLDGANWEAVVPLPPGDHPYCYFVLEHGGPRSRLEAGSVAHVSLRQAAILRSS